MFEIKTGIDIPTRMGKTAYPFASMEVGECFDLPANSDKEVNNWRSKLSQAKTTYREKSNPNFEISTRFLRDNGILRVWRAPDIAAGLVADVKDEE